MTLRIRKGKTTLNIRWNRIEMLQILLRKTLKREEKKKISRHRFKNWRGDGL